MLHNLLKCLLVLNIHLITDVPFSLPVIHHDGQRLGETGSLSPKEDNLFEEMDYCRIIGQ
jgi:hypothetical protein